MKDKIVVDSCCDVTSDMKKEMNITSVPLTMILGDKEFVDDESLDLANFADEMKRYKGKVGSAAPSPYSYQKAIEGAKNSYVVTLSSKLSGSHNSALVGYKDLNENEDEKAHVFDSKSASAGETLIAVKIHELIEKGINKTQIIETINHFIDAMKTYFVLENYDNLEKNGRLGKITSSLIQLLNIQLIMGSDGNGEIALFKKCRGQKKVLDNLISLIEKSKKNIENENIVISHNNNLSLAQQLSALITDKFKFKNIYIVQTGGLSSLYAGDKGIVLAF